MTDKHIPASKMLALPAYLIDGPDVILLSDLRALIDEAPDVEPVAMIDRSGEYDDCNEIVYFGDPGHELPDGTLFYTSPPDLTKLVGELVGALEHSRQCLELANMCGAINDTLWAGNAETLFDYMDAAISRAKEYLK